jgi:hypothetical protein
MHGEILHHGNSVSLQRVKMCTDYGGGFVPHSLPHMRPKLTLGTENFLGERMFACAWENDSEELGRNGADWIRAAQGLSASSDYCVSLFSFHTAVNFLYSYGAINFE